MSGLNHCNPCLDHFNLNLDDWLRLTVWTTFLFSFIIINIYLLSNALITNFAKSEKISADVCQASYLFGSSTMKLFCKRMELRCWNRRIDLRGLFDFTPEIRDKREWVAFTARMKAFPCSIDKVETVASSERTPGLSKEEHLAYHRKIVSLTERLIGWWTTNRSRPTWQVQSKETSRWCQEGGKWERENASNARFLHDIYGCYNYSNHLSGFF